MSCVSGSSLGPPQCPRFWALPPAAGVSQVSGSSPAARVEEPFKIFAPRGKFISNENNLSISLKRISSSGEDLKKYFAYFWPYATSNFIFYFILGCRLFSIYDIYIYICLYIHVCTYVRAHLHIHICMYVGVCVRKYIYMYIYIYVYV